MKVAEAVDHMTALYLRRIIDSFTKDFPKPEETRAREIILKNVDELTDGGRIDRKLTDVSSPYSTRILQHDVLAAPLDKVEQAGAEDGVVPLARNRRWMSGNGAWASEDP